MKKNPVLGVHLWKQSRIFLENRKAVKYKEIVAELRSSLRGVSANINIKLYFYTRILTASRQIWVI